MISPIISNLGILVFLPLLIALVRTPFSRGNYARQGFVFALSAILVCSLWRYIALYWAFGLSALFALLYLMKERPAFRMNALTGVSIAYVSWWFVSLIWSAAKQRGLGMSMEMLPLCVMCSYSCMIQLTDEEKQTIIRPFLQSAGIFVIVGLIAVVYNCIHFGILPWEWPFLQKSTINDLLVYRVVFCFLGGYTGYTHPSYNLLPLFLALCLMLPSLKEMGNHNANQTAATAAIAYAPSHVAKRKTMAIMFGLLHAGTLLLALFSQSRIGLIFSLVILPCAILFYTWHKPAVRWVVISVVALSCMAAGILLQPQIQSFKSDSVRKLMHELCWQYVQKKPWLGSGVGALNPVEMSQTIGISYWPNIGTIPEDATVMNWPYRTKMLPHNQFIADWAQTGIIGFVLSILLYLTMAVSILPIKAPFRASENALSHRIALTIFFFLFVVLSFLEYPLFIPKGLYLFGILGILQSRNI